MKLKDITKNKVSTKVGGEFFDGVDYAIKEDTDETPNRLGVDRDSDVI